MGSFLQQNKSPQFYGTQNVQKSCMFFFSQPKSLGKAMGSEPSAARFGARLKSRAQVV